MSEYKLQISEIGIPTMTSETISSGNERDVEKRAFELAKRFNAVVHVFRDDKYANSISVNKIMSVFQVGRK